MCNKRIDKPGKGFWFSSLNIVQRSFASFIINIVIINIIVNILGLISLIVSVYVLCSFLHLPVTIYPDMLNVFAMMHESQSNNL